MATVGKGIPASIQFVRVGLLLFTALFWITGFCLFVIGVWSVVKLNQYDDLSSKNYNSVAIVLIFVGLLIACVGFCGWCGALKKNSCLLKVFALCLAIIVLCELCAAISGYVYRSKIKIALSVGLNVTMSDYKKQSIGELWNKMQENFACCGNRHYSDWFNVVWHKTSINDSYSVPKSCCKHQDTKNCNTALVNNSTTDGKRVYITGCYDQITDFFQSKFSIIASGALGVALIQIICIACSGCLWTHFSKDKKYELV